MADPTNGPSGRVLFFEWDPEKNGVNIRKHGLNFADAPRVFRRRMLVALDDREDYGEDRWVGIGLLGERVVVIVFSEPDSQTIRVISMRRALRHEQQRCYEFIPK